MIATTLNEGLAGMGRTPFPDSTVAELRAVWDKLQAGTALTTDLEKRIAVEIGMNRPMLDALLALEQKPNRSTLLTQLHDALPALRADRDRTNWTATDRDNALRRHAANQLALIRLVAGLLDGTN